jgi:hypothetical protein
LRLSAVYFFVNDLTRELNARRRLTVPPEHPRVPARRQLVLKVTRVFSVEPLYYARLEPPSAAFTLAWCTLFCFVVW